MLKTTLKAAVVSVESEKSLMPPKVERMKSLCTVKYTHTHTYVRVCITGVVKMSLRPVTFYAFSTV